MDVLIESTRGFENNLQELGLDERAEIARKIDDCAVLFSTNQALAYGRLENFPFPQKLNGYNSSFYTFGVSQELRVILAIDEDPIFDQVIFTLFRLVNHDQLNKAYQDLTKSLYEEIGQQDQSAVLV